MALPGQPSYPVNALETPLVNPAFTGMGNLYQPAQSLGYPYNYTRNITHRAPTATAPTATGTLAERGIYLPITMRDDQGRTVSALTGLPAGGQAGGWQVPTAPGAAGGAGGGVAGGAGGGVAGGAGGSRGWLVPPGIDAGWYNQFRQEHGGETPEEFYGRNREGLAEALADREWAQGFAEMYGGPPSEDDWKAWYFHSRPGAGWAAMSKTERRDERRQLRKQSRNWYARQQGYKNWQELEKAEEDKGEKPPLYQPPQIYWR